MSRKTTNLGFVPDGSGFVPDGTSHRSRRLAALNPESVPIDERGDADLLDFVQKLCCQLIFYTADGSDPEPWAQGTWEDFPTPPPNSLHLTTADMAAYIDHPERFTAEASTWLGRPHFALLLTCIALLRHVRHQQNGIVRRHLDHHYREQLGMALLPPRPDRVAVLFQPAWGVREVLLPTGTLLKAGKDSTGLDRVYRTESELLIQRAQLCDLRTVFVDRRVTTLEDLRGATRTKDSQPKLFEEALRLALGEPEPGDAIPDWREPQPQPQHQPGTGTGTAQQTHHVNAEFLADLLERFADCSEKLYLEPQELRQLMRLHGQHVEPSNAEEIHRLLEQAGRSARKDPTWRLNVENTDFPGMLEAALHFPGGDENWPRGDEGVRALEFYNNVLRSLEKHLSMPVERLQAVASAAWKVISPTRVLREQEWDRLITILEEAHTERFRASRRQQIKPEGPPGDRAGFEETVIQVLSEIYRTQPWRDAGNWTWERAHAELGQHLSPGQMTVLEGFRDQLAAPRLTPRSARWKGEWQDVLVVLEFAQRTIGQVPDPVACREEWRNLHAAADARAQKMGPGRWATFGTCSGTKQAEPPEPNLGFSLRSSLLGLREGTRTVTLTLGFAAEGFQAFRKLIFADVESAQVTNLMKDEKNLGAFLEDQLVVRVSGGKGWLPLQICKARVSDCPLNNDDYWKFSNVPKPQTQPPDRPALQLVLEVGPKVDAFEPPLGEGAPALQLLLRQMWSDQEHLWITNGAFEPLRLEAVHLKVEVEGLADLVLQQEDRKLDAHQPFEPFGSHPTVGSRFYVSHPELIRHPLASLTFQLEWVGLAKTLSDQYHNYSWPTVTHSFQASGFKVDVELLEQQTSLMQFEQALFDEDAGPGAKGSRHFDPIVPQNFTYSIRPELAPGDDLRQDPRVWRWTLTPLDFGHDLYPALAAQKARELAAAIAVDPATAKSGIETYRVDPPYTPRLKELKANYTAAMEFVPGSLPKGSELLHVHPFGTSRIAPGANPSQPPPFLPRYASSGELYIGVSDADLPQSLSLLVQLAEGTSDPDLEPGTLCWQILDGDHWRDLTVRRDDTGGFLQSGIVVLDLPAVDPGCWLPSGMQWLRVTIDRTLASVCASVDLHAQAVMAEFLDQGNAPDHYTAPLAPGSIQGLLNPEARVASIEQPYSSVGGRPGERLEDLDQRVSEGLRHKQRALAAWDYERLVLQEFASRIHKVKCLAGSGEGRVDVIVIPDIHGVSPSDALAPKAPANLLDAIRRHLQARAPDGARVRVRSPRYQPFRIRLGVRFRNGQEERFLIERLNSDLVRFLSPWAYDESQEIRIGGAIHATSIVDFVDRLEYVDYAVEIHMFLLNARGIPFKKSSGLDASLQAQTPDSVLVTTPKHVIDPISDLGYQPLAFKGIGYMMIELDFMVAPKAPTSSPP